MGVQKRQAIQGAHFWVESFLTRAWENEECNMRREIVC
jgi:hypothetical protein